MSDEERDEAGLGADLEAELQELENEFDAAASHDPGNDAGPDDPAIAQQGPSGGAVRAAAPGVGGRSDLFEPEELEDECALAWGGLMRLYATRALELDPDDIPDGAIDAEETGRKLSPKVAAVANKWLPYISSRWSEEIRLAVAVASTSALTMYELAAVARQREEEQSDHEDAEEAEVE